MKPAKITEDEIWIDCQPIGFGMWIFAAFLRGKKHGWVAPVGFVWGVGCAAAAGTKGSRSEFMVFGSYVVPRWRRLGVRTAINKQILETYELITTSGGSPDGRKFLKASGYTFVRDGNRWVLPRRNKRADR